MKNSGILFGLATYGLWGLLPIYWSFLSHVPALEILSHRMVWSLLFIMLLLARQGRWQWLRGSIPSLRALLALLAAACMLAVNWFIYIWAVNAGFVVETSLGYFINPLINVLLGVLVLREVVRPGQWIAVAVAGTGVLYLTISYGSLPWIALGLAFSFGFYALLKKQTRLQSLEGLALETALLMPPALIYLIWLEEQGRGAFGHVAPVDTLLLMGAGVATAVPLLLFAATARRVPLTTIGFLQYIAPTIQFLLGIFYFRETLSMTRLVGFVIIWIALAIFTMEGLTHRRAVSRAPRALTQH